MKVGVLKRKRWRNTGIETFEKKVIPYLLEQEGFEPIHFEMEDNYPFSITVARFRVGRKIKKAASEYDKLFVPSQDLMSFDPTDVDAEIIPYVHDILPVTTNFSGWISTPLAKHYTNQIAKLDNVICASKATKNDLKYRTAFDEDAEVVYQGIDFPNKSVEGEREYDLIYVGSLIPRKNPSFVKEVFQRAVDQGYKVVSVNYKELDLPGEHRTNISDEELAELYADSKYYLHPAKAEGFGRGPVEAQANGCVPLGLDTEINNEILGERGKSWKAVTTPAAVFTELEKEERKAEEAVTNAQKFSWHKTREGILEVLKNG